MSVTSDVTLKKKGESITASDISVGDIVKLKYDGNNKLVQIKVSSKHKHTKPSQEKQTSEASKSDSSETSSKS